MNTLYSQTLAGMPQDSGLGPFIYLLYTSDLPPTAKATFADDTVILVLGDIVEDATAKQQSAVNKVNYWTKRLYINLLNDYKLEPINLNKIIREMPAFNSKYT